jgi:hypothetical protein
MISALYASHSALRDFAAQVSNADDVVDSETQLAKQLMMLRERHRELAEQTLVVARLCMRQARTLGAKESKRAQREAH